MFAPICCTIQSHCELNCVSGYVSINFFPIDWYKCRQILERYGSRNAIIRAVDTIELSADRNTDLGRPDPSALYYQSRSVGISNFPSPIRSSVAEVVPADAERQQWDNLCHLNICKGYWHCWWFVSSVWCMLSCAWCPNNIDWSHVFGVYYGGTNIGLKHPSLCHPKAFTKDLKW